MQLPERNDTFLVPSITVAGAIILIGVVFGTISGWWSILSAVLLFIGHGQEYKHLWLMPRSKNDSTPNR
tara:strand:- start:1759 stop:1965 length:207 start_codon:yes stop_codon:yes gene_type:complete